MEKRYEEMIICESNYSSYSEYKMAIIDTIDNLVKNGYVVVVRQEIDGVMILEFNHTDVDLSGYTLEWIGDDEYVETVTKADEEDSDPEYFG